MAGANGYGRPHRRARAALPPPDGEGCPFCGFAMWPDEALDADHYPPLALAAEGEPTELRWSHAACNRSAGARLGNGLRARPEDRPAPDHRRNRERWS